MAVVFLFNGVERGVELGYSITETANGRNNLLCSVPSPDGSYRPALDTEVIVEHDAVRIYGGTIQTPIESGLTDDKTPIKTSVDAIDFNSFFDRRYMTQRIPEGTLKDALLIVEDYMSDYGVTLDPSQPDGPDLPELPYSRRKVKNVMDELSALTGWQYEIDYNKVLRMWEVGTRSAPFNIGSDGQYLAGEVTVESSRASSGATYANRVYVMAGTPEVPIIAESNDEPEQAAHGLWEIVIEAPTIFEQELAQALADVYLLQRTPTPKTVTYFTRTPGLHPGQVQTINIPWRGVNNTFLIRDVSISSQENNLLYQITALEGSIFQPGWRNMYEQLLSPMTEVTVVPGGSTTGYGRTVFYLGGTYSNWVQWDSTLGAVDWMPVDGKLDDAGTEITLDTVSRGTNLATVTARIRAMAGGVTARLRNVSDDIVVGTSALVTSDTLVTVVFPCTLTNGSKVYRLELLPTLADTDVQAAHSYLE